MFSVKRHAKIFFLIASFTFFSLVCFVIYGVSVTDVRLYNDAAKYGSGNLRKKDWHDYEMMEAALKRQGPGEIGAPVLFAEYTQALYKRYGFEAVLSDLISLNRSLPDLRHENCKAMTYLSDLPKSAMIIIFYNERLSVLLRTVYSILNRTPAELIEEIILVDDGSTWSDLLKPLDDFLETFLPTSKSKVRLLRLPKRKGLMVARMMGARSASKASQVLIFLDSHFEMMYNWLPPLLEPIALNPKACTIPSLDRIAYNTFQYEHNNELRGYFDWSLNYQMRALHPHELKQPAKNFRAYIMMGGALAIGAEFFWQLGGFDEGMQLWGGEQFEISFKIWMCGGELINVPCSRLGHLYRDPDTKGNTNLYNDYAFVDKNYRRLIDVWFDDEHRNYVLAHRSKAAKTDPGDLSERFAVRNRLQCKSFTWMLDNIMPDMKALFPPIKPDDFGNGTIRSFANPDLCLVLYKIGKEQKIILEKCNAHDQKHVWVLSWRCELRADGINTCIEADVTYKHVNAYNCHLSGGNQKWFYDVKRRWLIHVGSNLCMLANEAKSDVELATCDIKNLGMKWFLASYNETALSVCQANE